MNVYKYNCNNDLVIDNDINSIGNINPYLFKGYYYDRESGLYYLKSRYYNPEVSRFISPDSIEYLDQSSINGLNLYCYCYNNPIIYVDDMGNLPVPVDVITSIIEYSADLYSFGLKMSLKSMPELSMAVAKKWQERQGIFSPQEVILELDIVIL